MASENGVGGTFQGPLKSEPLFWFILTVLFMESYYINDKSCLVGIWDKKSANKNWNKLANKKTQFIQLSPPSWEQLNIR